MPEAGSARSSAQSAQSTTGNGAIECAGATAGHDAAATSSCSVGAPNKHPSTTRPTPETRAESYRLRDVAVGACRAAGHREAGDEIAVLGHRAWNIVPELLDDVLSSSEDCGLEL